MWSWTTGLRGTLGTPFPNKPLCTNHYFACQTKPLNQVDESFSTSSQGFWSHGHQAGPASRIGLRCRVNPVRNTGSPFLKKKPDTGQTWRGTVERWFGSNAQANCPQRGTAGIRRGAPKLGIIQLSKWRVVIRPNKWHYNETSRVLHQSVLCVLNCRFTSPSCMAAVNDDPWIAYLPNPWKRM